MKSEIALAYDQLTELKREYAANANAALLLDCLAERAEVDGFDLKFVEWVGKAIVDGSMRQ